MNAFATHPSVRIRGTENNYEPVQCLLSQCMNKTAHMHCPFCTKNEVFVDPVILKAHYRVKHVDKGIEFAGLKILRCCDHCDIVGTIKGVKEFKGAHWHCYKCKNGFNRRDEAIKHYRTHFRNPQTTFQIQITQINQSYQLGQEVETATETLTQDDLSTIHPALTEAVMSTSATDALLTNHQTGATIVNGKSTENDVHVSVAANETVGTSEGQTIMIIQQEPIDSGQDASACDNTTTYQITNVEGGMQFSSVADTKADLENQVYELQQRNTQMEMEKRQLEHDLRAEIDQLKIQVQMQSNDMAAYQKREQEMLAQLSIPLDERIHDLLVQLKADHEDLLHQQLAQLRRVYLAQCPEGGESVEAGQTSSETITIHSVPGDQTIERLTPPLGNSETEFVIVNNESPRHEVSLENGVHMEHPVDSEGDVKGGDNDNVTTSIVTSSDNQFENTVTLSEGDLEHLQSQVVQEETDTTVSVINEDEPPAKRKKENT